MAQCNRQSDTATAILIYERIPIMDYWMRTPPSHRFIIRPIYVCCAFSFRIRHRWISLTAVIHTIDMLYVMAIEHTHTHAQMENVWLMIIGPNRVSLVSTRIANSTPGAREHARARVKWYYTGIVHRTALNSHAFKHMYTCILDMWLVYLIWFNKKG